MKPEHWTMIIVALITTLGVLANTFFAKWLENPKASGQSKSNPELQKQDKTSRQVKNAQRIRLARPWRYIVDFAMVAVPGFSLYRELQSDHATTRLTIFFIAFLVAMVFANVTLLLAQHIGESFWQAIGKATNMSIRHDQDIWRSLDRIVGVLERSTHLQGLSTDLAALHQERADLQGELAEIKELANQYERLHES